MWSTSCGRIALPTSVTCNPASRTTACSHLAAVNTVTFMDEGRRLVTTSDDKTIRVWEWDIPVDTKVVAEPGMHAIPATTVYPNRT